MNMFKKNGGFTLVELIVVIAILAILAAVAVPAYSGYISKANDTADTTALAAVKTACMGAMAKEASVTSIEVTASAGVISAVKVNGSVVLYGTGATGEKAEDFMIFMNNALPTLKATGSFAKGATWSTSGANANKWVGVN